MLLLEVLLQSFVESLYLVDFLLQFHDLFLLFKANLVYGISLCFILTQLVFKELHFLVLLAEGLLQLISDCLGSSLRLTQLVAQRVALSFYLLHSGALFVPQVLHLGGDLSRQKKVSLEAAHFSLGLGQFVLSTPG